MNLSGPLPAPLLPEIFHAVLWISDYIKKDFLMGVGIIQIVI